VNFTKEEQVGLTVHYIEKVIPSINQGRVASRLRAYEEIVELEGREEKFEDYMLVILQKY